MFNNSFCNHLVKALIASGVFVAGSLPVCAVLDLNGNGVSEIWELQNASTEVDESDLDGDGFSNRHEAIAGTSPGDPSDFLVMELDSVAGGELVFGWRGVGGKSYRIESWDVALGTWQGVMSLPPALLDGQRTASFPDDVGKIFRLAVTDVDMDGDGLSAWEEVQLGWSDSEVRSSEDPTRGDFAVALRRLESPDGMALGNGEMLERLLPGETEAARFLLRASFGPTDESISKVMEVGFSGWLDEQMSLPITTLQTMMGRNSLSITTSNLRHAWWRAANTTEDQLRHRLAYALSQIMVVNLNGGSVIGDNIITQALYYDIFTKGAFGSYRDILEDVTYSPIMGFYLSHLKNRKADDPDGPTRFPDENFAREIMQLFTIGLWELDPDGTRKVDEDGKFVPTYDNTTITEMAKVFTGMSHSTTNNGRPAGSFFNVPGGNDYWFPMKVWDEEHEPGPKTIIGGVVLDGTQTGEEEVQAALDALIDHESCAPFVCRLLIQRFTSSNPSPKYLARVTQVWDDGEAGDAGNLGKIMEAILLDPEVLAGERGGDFGGKVREPILRFASLARAFNFSRPDGKYALDINLINENLGQYPTLAPSVFNFYLPDFSPEGELREAGLVSPELQLATMTQMIVSDSRFSSTVQFGHNGGTLDFEFEEELAVDPEALVDRVDLLLTGRSLSDETRATILAAVQSKPSLVTRVRVAVYLVSQSMECIVLK